MAARSAVRLGALARAAGASAARPSLAAATPAVAQAAHSSTSAAASSSSQLPAPTLSQTPTAVPSTLPSPFDFSKTHAPTHGHHVASLHLRCYGAGDVTLQNLDFFADFALRAAYALGMPVSRPASLPRRVSLWTVPKGPFVHKKAQENFTRTTHARVIKVYDSHPHVVERWLHFCRIHAMPGLGQRAEVYRHYPLSLASQMEESARAQLRPRVAPRDGSAAVTEGEGASGAGSQTDAILALARGLRVELDQEDAAGARALESERASVEQGEASTEAQAGAEAQQAGEAEQAGEAAQKDGEAAAEPAQEKDSQQAAKPAQPESEKAAESAQEKESSAEKQ